MKVWNSLKSPRYSSGGGFYSPSWEGENRYNCDGKGKGGRGLYSKKFTLIKRKRHTQYAVEKSYLEKRAGKPAQDRCMGIFFFSRERRPTKEEGNRESFNKKGKGGENITARRTRNSSESVTFPPL